MPALASAEEKEGHWRPLVLELHRRWLEAKTVRAGDMRLPDGGELPDEVRPSEQMAKLTGNDALAHLERRCWSNRSRRGMLVFLCGPQCMEGKPCHRAHFIQPATQFLEAAFACSTMPSALLNYTIPQTLSPPPWQWSPLPVVASDEQARAVMGRIVDGIV
eukprot:7366212-Prymnesium_polylepis.1